MDLGNDFVLLMSEILKGKQVKDSMSLQLKNICHSFGKLMVLESLDITTEQGSRLCILGPSGSGKTTLLRIIAGLIPPDNGSVFINGEDQKDCPTNKRDLGFVFQSPNSLLPHLNVYNNIAFPLRRRKKQSGFSENKINQLVTEIISIVELGAYRNSSIQNLSGGEKQRVALARALVYKPSLLLLDEPLSSLDNLRRDTIISLLLSLHQQYQNTIVYVTHDEREALRIGTHVAVINNGSICQYAETQTVISKPSSPVVAKIIGGWNLIHGEVNHHQANMINLPSGTAIEICKEVSHKGILRFGVPVTATEYLNDMPEETDGMVHLSVEVSAIHPWQGTTMCECRLNCGQAIRALCRRDVPISLNSGVIRFNKEKIHVFPNQQL